MQLRKADIWEKMIDNESVALCSTHLAKELTSFDSGLLKWKAK